MNNKAIFDNKALNQLKKITGSGGGMVLVDELPEIGEPLTIYELSETIPASYNWALSIPYAKKWGYLYDTVSSYRGLMGSIVIETSDEFNPEVNSNYMYVYIRTEDKLYNYDTDTNQYVELQKEEQSGVFSKQVKSKTIYYYIVKDYVIFEEFEDMTLTLLDDTEIEVFPGDKVFGGALKLNQLNGATFFPGGIPLISITGENELPTAKELIEQENANWNDSSDQVDILHYFNPTNNTIYITYSTGEVDGVYYRYDIDNYRFIITDESGEYDPENPEVYEGKLQWDSIITNVYTTQPEVLLSEDFFCVLPQNETIKKTHYIYTENSWLNIDELQATTFDIRIDTYPLLINNLNRTFTIEEKIDDESVEGYHFETVYTGNVIIETSEIGNKYWDHFKTIVLSVPVNYRSIAECENTSDISKYSIGLMFTGLDADVEGLYIEPNTSSYTFVNNGLNSKETVDHDNIKLNVFCVRNSLYSYNNYKNYSGLFEGNGFLEINGPD